MNKSTSITLNDRFTIISKTIDVRPQTQPRRARSRSRSRGRQPQPQTLQGSNQNRTFLNQLEKKHKMRLALKLKNVSQFLILK